MIEETIDNTGAVPGEVSADAGYYSAGAVEDRQALGVDPFIAPEQTRHGRVPPPAPRGRIPSICSPGTGCVANYRPSGVGSATRCAWKRSLARSKQGRGFRQFLLRGLEKVKGEWSLICTGHNLLKLFRFGSLTDGNRRRPHIWTTGNPHR